MKKRDVFQWIMLKITAEQKGNWFGTYKYYTYRSRMEYIVSSSIAIWIGMKRDNI